MENRHSPSHQSQVITAANALTALRLVLSPVLLFLRPCTPAFYGIYLLCGLTDMADGRVARKTGSVTRFGSVLDSIADAVFAAVCLIRLLPAFSPKPFVWGLMALICLVKLVNLLCGCCRYHRLVFPHTATNKLTGLLLFALPPALRYVDVNIAAIPVGGVALFAAVQEGRLILTGTAMPLCGRSQSGN